MDDSEVMRHCVIHRYASSQGHATGLLKLQNLLVRELARELVEHLTNGMISCLIVDLFMDPACVSNETFGKWAG